MIGAGGSGAGAALGGAMAGGPSGQSAPSVLAAKVDGANKKAGKLGGDKKGPCLQCPCLPEKLKSNVLNCSGSKAVWDQAKAAAGRTPRISVDPVQSDYGSSAYGGKSDSSGKVTINPNPDCCVATQYAVFELNNVINSKKFNDLDSNAAAGNVGREEYARATEKIEFDGTRNTSNSFDSCKKSWGCSENAKALYGEGNKFPSFDDYYDQISNSAHTNDYRNDWDAKYKSAYDAKHP